jgi:diaminohydroxyphosphoribosylaminopyrimidine deaminase/5-amino-6-(5-phosphoribosylamino)uracil reductase
MACFDEEMMRRALALAERGRGAVEPNPLVGAVLVRDGQVVGEGWHERFGGPHAEVLALAAAGEAARGATLYVTLEPCCHHGKTPPCTDAVLRAGVARVVVALGDPFPQVAGRGLDILRSAGLAVEVGLAEDLARAQNAPYLKLLQTGRPYVLVKWAMTLDGKIATRTGDSKWITGEAARGRVHQLRGRVDAILVGIGTVLVDDPLLTSRPPGPRVAARVVLDSRLRLPPDSQLVRTARDVPVVVFHSPAAPAEARAALERAGCECRPLAAPSGPGFLREALDELGRRRLTNLLVEGGAHVLASFLEAGEVDEVWAFIAPKLAGGDRALSPIAGPGIARIAEAWHVEAVAVEKIGEDLLVRGRLKEAAGGGRPRPP